MLHPCPVLLIRPPLHGAAARWQQWRGICRCLGGGWGAKAKLSHDHRTQFVFCHQTFTLWREVMTHMYKLWCLADEDLLSSSGGGYQLFNTGQGLNRVQRCPRVANEMSKILSR